MSELPLDKVIEDAIIQWCSDNGGFPMGFIFAVDLAMSDGANHLFVGTQENQPTHRSLGLAAYLDLWFRDDAQRIWLDLEVQGEDE